MQKGYEEEAARQGVVVEVLLSIRREHSGTVAVFETVLQKKYDGIAFSPITPVNLIPTVIKANEQGIPVVNVDEGVDQKAYSMTPAGKSRPLFAPITMQSVKQQQILSPRNCLTAAKLPLSKAWPVTPAAMRDVTDSKIRSPLTPDLKMVASNRRIGIASKPWM
jgi:hypothetical protein